MIPSILSKEVADIRFCSFLTAHGRKENIVRVLQKNLFQRKTIQKDCSVICNIMRTQFIQHGTYKILGCTFCLGGRILAAGANEKNLFFARFTMSGHGSHKLFNL